MVGEEAQPCWKEKGRIGPRTMPSLLSSKGGFARSPCSEPAPLVPAKIPFASHPRNTHCPAAVSTGSQWLTASLFSRTDFGKWNSPLLGGSTLPATRASCRQGLSGVGKRLSPLPCPYPYPLSQGAAGSVVWLVFPSVRPDPS